MKNKIRLTKDLFWKNFNYSTNACELTSAFAYREISGRAWINYLNETNPIASKFACRLIRDCGGVNNCRKRLRRFL